MPEARPRAVAADTIVPWSRVIALALAITFAILAAMHVGWAIRGTGKSAAVPVRPDGSQLFTPGPVPTLAVAALLVLASAIVLARAAIIGLPVPPSLIRLGTWGVAATFALRTIGEFKYVGLFRRVRGTTFATWDARLFTPLCALVAVGTAWVAAS